MKSRLKSIQILFLSIVLVLGTVVLSPMKAYAFEKNEVDALKEYKIIK